MQQRPAALPVVAPYSLRKRKICRAARIAQTDRGGEEVTMASADVAGWTEEAEASEVDQTVEEEQGEGSALGEEGADIGYEQLLGRVFTSLDVDHPGLVERRSQPIFRPPNVLREGRNKTVFFNFMDTCERMHRQPKHVMDFLLSAMGTSGSLDGQQWLVVKGRFTPRAFSAILRRYTYEYVICSGCKFPDTTLSREKRLLCGQCGFSRKVAPIKARTFT